MREIWFQGHVVPWEDARVHVWDEVALRGASVFEGIRAFWDDSLSDHVLLAYPEHLDRLATSARLIDTEIGMARDDVRAAVQELLPRFAGEDVYLRPTFFVASGRSSLSPGSETGLYVGAFSAATTGELESVSAIVSSYRRGGGVISPRAKAGGTYLDFRLLERERLRSGVDHVLVPDLQGHIAEADGAAVLMLTVDGRTLVTPPDDSDSLRSVTRAVLADIAGSLGIEVQRRAIARDDLFSHDVALAGTQIGVRRVVTVDGSDVARSSALEELNAAYTDLCRGRLDLGRTYLTPCRAL